MPSTRSGKTDNSKVGTEHQGRYARVSGAFLSAPHKNDKKRKTAEHPATRLRSCEQEQHQKTTPMPTKKQLANIRRAMRNGKPTCQHLGINKESRDLLYPEHYFCDNTTFAINVKTM
jgi:hypothetical protein